MVAQGPLTTDEFEQFYEDGSALLRGLRACDVHADGVGYVIKHNLFKPEELEPAIASITEVR